MAALTFEQGVITVAESCEVSAEEQQLTVPVETNLDYTVTIESGAETWLSRVETRALRVDHLFFHVTENLGATRSAVITLTSGSLTRTVVVAQLAGGEGGEPTPEVPPTTGTVELDRLYGYAAGTTGGEAATPEHIHHFDDGHKFGEWLRLREKNKEMTPAIVYLSGTFHSDEGRGSGSPWFDIKRTGNLSIYGTEGFVMENVGFFLNEAENVIIRNIYIKMPKADNGADGISMQESHHIWVDHCTFESMNQTKDYEDGSCDITHASHDVTVSWCHFIKTQKSCLVGHSNSATGDAAITATFHHNYFDTSSSRHPRVRYGRVHVYNNFFREVSTYGVGSAYGAMVLVEDNLFDGVRLPTDICTFPAKQEGSNWVSNLEGSLAGFLYARANVFENRPANATEPYPLTNVEYKAYDGERLATPYTYDDFKPAYDYIVDPADQLATIVPAGAGAGKLADYASAPVEVDNGGITTEPDPGTDPGTDPEEPQGGIDLGNGWTALSCGDAAATASTEGGLLTLTARGKFESGGQNFGYVYREVTGDFTATVTVESYETGGTSNQSLAGLLLDPRPLGHGHGLPARHGGPGARDELLPLGTHRRGERLARHADRPGGERRRGEAGASDRAHGRQLLALLLARRRRHLRQGPHGELRRRAARNPLPGSGRQQRQQQRQRHGCLRQRDDQRRDGRLLIRTTAHKQSGAAGYPAAPLVVRPHSDSGFRTEGPLRYGMPRPHDPAARTRQDSPPVDRTVRPG